ncbi:dnaA protein helix-turn-helix [Cohaesibacter sp. ES.047]|uniref:helix-turn-helix domain-containing protein n=1 Tax=Cohaesibacter sp. ES.047 TaxID=1798205 RepID=UPI000BB763B3|nr:helix-turn-helix domain-containing protein [Cohaesibacter sp. ES.047]SNY92778.1 dnaA protein helix-turn-helix [Cohaesibacter sp. ES.047]
MAMNTTSEMLQDCFIREDVAPFSGQFAERQTQYQALDLVDQLVARTFRMPRSALHAGTRCRKSVAFARQVAMYLGHVCLSYPLKDIASHYGRDRTTVAYACRVVEDRREEEGVELLINSMESALETIMLLTPLTCTRP